MRVSIILLGSAFPSLAAATTYVELSAPLFPMVDVLYEHEGESYPESGSERDTLAAGAFMSYDDVLQQCSDRGYPVLTAGAADTATSDQIAANYNTVASCAYEEFTSKPYFIPRLVGDVDLCALHMGADWHLPTVEEIEAMPADVFRRLEEILTESVGEGQMMGSFYFSLGVYARTGSGDLVAASLYGDVDARTAALDGDLREHLETMPLGWGEELVPSPIVVRCLREVEVASDEAGETEDTGSEG